MWVESQDVSSVQTSIVKICVGDCGQKSEVWKEIQISIIEASLLRSTTSNKLERLEEMEKERRSPYVEVVLTLPNTHGAVITRANTPKLPSLSGFAHSPSNTIHAFSKPKLDIAM